MQGDALQAEKASSVEEQEEAARKRWEWHRQRYDYFAAAATDMQTALDDPCSPPCPLKARTGKCLHASIAEKVAAVAPLSGEVFEFYAKACIKCTSALRCIYISKYFLQDGPTDALLQMNQDALEGLANRAMQLVNMTTWRALMDEGRVETQIKLDEVMDICVRALKNWEALCTAPDLQEAFGCS